MSFAKLPLLAIGLTLLITCSGLEDPGAVRNRSTPQTAEEIAFAKSVLNDLQAQSIAQNREFCGFIGLDEDGDYISTTPTRGRKGSCQPEREDDFEPLASFHTHGAHSADYDSELPSTDDLLADMDEGIDGYIGTPGGRVWFNDSSEESAMMLCGERCINSDPGYDPNDAPPPAKEYDLDGLYDRENSPI
ncbi:hypothetical protein ROA7450_01189 [Roseovarius albus]|uniref:DUF4329 domain-containing protein n=1 Tax=Roseovarius albus TaxID=1247867 RepID=A0A1X6YQQ4_9RHOB|nr:DUF4329 domain-containing protein [Roseovarius albus]SLN28627.1 hypothetical protein ROA7450_01189 [Roseovarius albus]